MKILGLPRAFGRSISGWANVPSLWYSHCFLEHDPQGVIKPFTVFHWLAIACGKHMWLQLTPTGGEEAA
jgi:hypothetical protein